MPSEVTLQLVDRSVAAPAPLRRRVDGRRRAAAVDDRHDRRRRNDRVEPLSGDGRERRRATCPVGARQQLAWSLADVYEYRVDMSRDLQDGDAFKVVAERIGRAQRRDADRQACIAATFNLSGSKIDAVRFASESVERRVLRPERQVDARGVSARAARVPPHLERLRQARASDPRRLAPAQGHRLRGGDRARRCAPSATASSSREGWGSGYGNVLEIRHRNGFVTRYGHLQPVRSGHPRRDRA